MALFASGKTGGAGAPPPPLFRARNNPFAVNAGGDEEIVADAQDTVAAPGAGLRALPQRAQKANRARIASTEGQQKVETTKPKRPRGNMKILPLPRSRPSEDRAADMEKRGILPPPAEGILPLPPPGGVLPPPGGATGGGPGRHDGGGVPRRGEKGRQATSQKVRASPYRGKDFYARFGDVERKSGDARGGRRAAVLDVPHRGSDFYADFSQRTGAGASSRDRGVAAGKGTVLPPPAGSGSGIASQRRTKKPPPSQYRGKEFYANFSSGGGSSASAKAEGDDPESGDVDKDLGDFEELMNGAGADDDLNPFTEENLEIFAEVGEEDIQEQSSDGEKGDDKYDWVKYDLRAEADPSEFSNKWRCSREGSEADGMQGVSSEDAGLLGHGSASAERPMLSQRTGLSAKAASPSNPSTVVQSSVPQPFLSVPPHLRKKNDRMDSTAGSTQAQRTAPADVGCHSAKRERERVNKQVGLFSIGRETTSRTGTCVVHGKTRLLCYLIQNARTGDYECRAEEPCKEKDHDMLASLDLERSEGTQRPLATGWCARHGKQRKLHYLKTTPTGEYACLPTAPCKTSDRQTGREEMRSPEDLEQDSLVCRPTVAPPSVGESARRHGTKAGGDPREMAVCVLHQKQRMRKFLQISSANGLLECKPSAECQRAAE